MKHFKRTGEPILRTYTHGKRADVPLGCIKVKVRMNDEHGERECWILLTLAQYQELEPGRKKDGEE